MAAPPTFKRFSPLRLEPGFADAEIVNRNLDNIRGALDALNEQIWRTYVTLPPGAAPGSTSTGEGPWLDNVTVYASPLGSDSNPGDSKARPKKYGYSAAEQVVKVGGGTVDFVDGTTWGGPVANQGPWLRGDGLTVPGFLPDVPMRIRGSLGGVYSQFAFAAASRMIGGATAGGGRFKPNLWSTRTSFPFIVEDYAPNGNTIANTPYRVGWDYRRNADGSVCQASITQWARAAGQAVVDVALPAGIPITAASRTGGNIVTLTFASTAPLPLPLSRADQQWIKVTSSDGNFPSGDKQIFASNGVDTVQYLEAGPNVAGGAIGSWASHSICTYDLVEVTSVNAQVPSTFYTVIAVVSATEFVVTDPYGFGPRSAAVVVANPGQYVLQDRFNYASGVTTFRNCQGGCIANSSVDTFEAGPVFDFGGSQDGRQLLEWCANSGGYALNATAAHFADEDRAACYFFNGGAAGTPAFTMRDMRPAAGAIRVYPSRLGTSFLDIRRVIPDIMITAAAPPVIDIIRGNFAYQLIADSCYNTDNVDPTVNNVRYDVGYPTRVDIRSCGKPEGPGAHFSGISGRNGDWQGETESPMVTQQTGQWVDGRYSGRVPTTYRAPGAIFSARWQNLIPDDATTWLNGIGAVVTPGQPDPWGGNTAVNVAGTGLFRFTSHVTAGNAVGDRWLVGGLVSRAGGFDPGTPDLVFQINQAGDNGAWNLQSSVSFKGQGEWQTIGNIFKLNVATVPNDNTIAYANVVTTLGLCNPFLIRIPVALGISDNEIWEYLFSLNPHPSYLAPGTSGTAVGRPFIAHGGMGVANANLLAPSGANAVLQKWEVRLKEDGTANKYAPLFDRAGTLIDVSAIGGAVPATRRVDSVVTETSGGGALSADRTIGLADYGSPASDGHTGQYVEQVVHTDVKGRVASAQARDFFTLPFLDWHFTYGGQDLGVQLPSLAVHGALPNFWLRPNSGYEAGLDFAAQDQVWEWEVGGDYANVKLDVFVYTCGLTASGGPDSDLNVVLVVTKNGADTACTVSLSHTETNARFTSSQAVSFSSGDRIGVRVHITDGSGHGGGTYSSGALRLASRLRATS